MRELLYPFTHVVGLRKTSVLSSLLAPSMYDLLLLCSCFVGIVYCTAFSTLCVLQFLLSSSLLMDSCAAAVSTEAPERTKFFDWKVLPPVCINLISPLASTKIPVKLTLFSSKSPLLLITLSGRPLNSNFFLAAKSFGLLDSKGSSEFGIICDCKV